MTKLRNLQHNCQDDGYDNTLTTIEQRKQRDEALPMAFVLKLFVFVVLFGNISCAHEIGPVMYKGHLSMSRIDELNNIGIGLEKSMDIKKQPCESYYDRVCSRNWPLYSVLGHLPNLTEIMQLMTKLQDEREHFEMKQKVQDFFISCNTVKGIEDCYLETFVYFKPVFGYVIAKYYIASDSHKDAHGDFLDVLGRFITQAERTEDFLYNPIKMRLANLRDQFHTPHLFFRTDELNKVYQDLRIYRESYDHNLRNFEKHRRQNNTYSLGIHRTMLDWTFYVFQSRHKPRSYYYATLNVHLWMSLYNSTVRYYEPRRLHDIAECLTLPQYLTVLEEARILAVVYLKSFRSAWREYVEWIKSTTVNMATHDQENEILRQYEHLNNNKLFFILYAQNFCDFGKELAEHIFYLGLKESVDFGNVYHCYTTHEPRLNCVP